ncbi:hypothetical protein ES708_16515 [subsurface metagenome]
MLKLLNGIALPFRREPGLVLKHLPAFRRNKAEGWLGTVSPGGELEQPSRFNAEVLATFQLEPQARDIFCRKELRRSRGREYWPSFS